MASGYEKATRMGGHIIGMRDSIYIFLPFDMIDFNPQACGPRLAINGFSHGLTNCPPDSSLPRLRRGRPFESATPVKTKNTT